MADIVGSERIDHVARFEFADGETLEVVGGEARWSPTAESLRGILKDDRTVQEIMDWQRG